MEPAPAVGGTCRVVAHAVIDESVQFIDRKSMFRGSEPFGAVPGTGARICNLCAEEFGKTR